MKTKTILTLVVMAIFTLLQSCQKETEKKAFVKTDGINFTVDGTPYYFVGANFWYGAYLGADAEYGNRDRLLRELDNLERLGINNLRIMAASEESDFALPLSPPFQYKNGEYNETLFQGLDFLLAEMGKRNLRAVLVLNNYWDWTGGMSQYVSWTTGEDVFDPVASKGHTWDQAMEFSARFYEIEEAQELYRKYINTIVNRENIYTKETYKNDPTIMAWQLANEPRPSKEGDVAENVKKFSKWVDETAGYIKSVDPNHLVSTGSEGSKGTLNTVENALQSQESDNIDYTTFHMWPKNWGWYKAESPDMKSTKENAAQYIAEHIEIARKLNKPSVIEEFGFVRDGETFSPDSAVAARNEFYGFMLDLLKNSIQEGKAISGLNFWGWGGEGRAQQSDYKWKSGDVVYTGDPYGEAQGLNSIYDTDKSTLDIISKVAHELEEMSSRPKR
ncbi:MAG: glycoside hydrolase 5 family protein [Candidatus Saccharimonadaceae bacterium]